MIEYRPKTTNIILNMILVVFIVSVVFILKGGYNNLFIFIVIILVAYFLYFFKKRLICLKIFPQEKNVCLTFKSYLILEKREAYKIEDLKYSFGYQLGARGTKRKEFRLYMAITSKLLFSIVPNFDGWSETVIQDIINELIKLGLKK